MSDAEAAERVCGPTGEPCPNPAACASARTCMADAPGYETFDRDPACSYPGCEHVAKSYVGRLAHERTHEDRKPCPNGCGHAPLSRTGMVRHLRKCGQPAAALAAVPDVIPGVEDFEPDGPEPWRRRLILDGIEVQVTIVADGLDMLELTPPVRTGLAALLNALDALARATT